MTTTHSSVTHENLSAWILAYESGELDNDQVDDLFQHLIDTRIAWELQGSYGRTALALIKAGRCYEQGN